MLGSTSRYRRALLERLGLPFVVAAPDVDETALPGEAPAATALRLSEAKARAVATRFADALVIGSDQVADCDGRADRQARATARAHSPQLRDAVGTHRRLPHRRRAGRCASGRCRSELVDVASTFRTLRDAEIAAYLDASSPTTAPAACAPKRSASRSSSASPATTRPR